MNANGFRRALLRWYKKNKRSLPWRNTQDPYKIWVSEVLLQQTQVKTVIPYYENFISEFPDVQSLSRASLDRVLKVCEGAGYYARIRNLKKASDVVCGEFLGKIPQDTGDLRKIPGVGEYTAAAVSSIAFGMREPVLDGNVKRVLARLFCIKNEISLAETLQEMREKSRWLMGRASPGDFNQAMMELGAVVCVPGNPNCDVCPVKNFCEAAGKNTQDRFPVKKRKKAPPHFPCAVGIIYKAGKILISKRKPDGFLGGLWEFPGGKVNEGETPAQCLHREVKEETGIKIKIHHALASVKHAYTHFRVTLYPFVCEWESGDARPLSGEKVLWVKPAALKNFAFPSANRKIFPLLRRAQGV